MISRIKQLVNQLNSYRNEYYNNQTSLISDYEYDQLFDELKSLEEATSIIMSNSPTQTVGYEVMSSLEKIKHSHPMLSLDKTKSIDDLKKFAGSENCVLSLKLDGLTILLTYDNGKLIRAETRGNGEIGEVVTHNAKAFENIPLNIEYKGYLEVEGEAIITDNDFQLINDSIENPDEKYKNSRNLVSGSVRQLDSNIASKRHIRFIAWKVPTPIESLGSYNNSGISRLNYIKKFGFDIVPFLTYINGSYDEEHIEEMIEALRRNANANGYPIDGLVMNIDDIPYAMSLGATGHHPKHSIAYKFYDEEVETTLRGIEWSTSKTGLINPIAIFDEVDLGGALTTRATLHNVSYIEELELGIGDIVTVYRANDVIPKLSENFTRSNTCKIPNTCPICGEDAEIKQDNESKILVCTNPNCNGKLLGKLTHFASKNAMNIEGLSEVTIEKFIDFGWLNEFIDIYKLKEHTSEMTKLSGFGKKSVDKLINAIEKSRNTTLDRFIYALSIPMIGRTASKTISDYCNGDFKEFYSRFSADFGFDWSQLEDFGANTSASLANYSIANKQMVKELSEYMSFVSKEPTVVVKAKNIAGKTFVITGALNTFSNRDEAKERIEALGGKVSGSVSTKTSYLVNNDINSTSGKNKKAKELNIPIITEEELIYMMQLF